ncbi:zinc finger protein 687 [Trichonephila clavipes]|nr:zinc finger protein 687 [Trichonephila clavipes]
MYCCSDCGDTFTLKSSLSFHLDRRSVLIQLPCEACKSVQIFYNRCTLKSHIRSHADKNEPSDIEKAVVNPLPCELMDGLQTEVVNTLDDELNCMYEANEMPPSELLEFSMKEDDDTIIIKEKPIPTNALKVKCVDCNEEFENAAARKEHLTNGDKIPVLISQCNKCRMVCPSKCSLKAHQRLHLQVSPYICPECGENPDAYLENFQNHVKYKCFHHARSIGYKCPVCKRVSPSSESLLKHMEWHTKKYLKCDSCPRAYMTMLSFDNHVKEHHMGKYVKFNTVYKCSFCDTVFLGSEQMLTHRSTHLKEQVCEYVFNCMQCGKTVKNKEQLLDHIKNSHPKVYKLTSQVEQIEANSSSQPIASYKDEKCLDAHLSKNHVGKLEYCSVCPICKELLPTFHRALNHLRVEHFLVTKDSVNQEEESDVNARKKNVTCHFCRTALDDDAKLQEHLKTKHHVDYQKQQNNRKQPASEEKEQPLKKQCIKGNTCAKCDFQSSNREIFKKHVRTHKINKDTFQCQECDVCLLLNHH